MLVLKDLAKTFGGKAAVAGVSCEFEPQRITGLIGPNGAGKTTVFNMVSGLLKPTTGSVFFDGRNITGKAPHAVARMGIGRGFQRTRLFNALTALENVLVSLPAVTHRLSVVFAYGGARRKQLDEQAVHYLERLGITHLAGRRASELSYGDQRSVMLACLLASGATTLLLDEPTSGIDPAAREKVLKQILALRDGGQTIVLVEHNLDVVRGACERVLFLAEGKVLASGTPAEIESDPVLTKLYFGSVHA
jgi:ABC-type branched-subunit amino acid transport system ATPase component